MIREVHDPLILDPMETYEVDVWLESRALEGILMGANGHQPMSSCDVWLLRRDGSEAANIRLMDQEDRAIVVASATCNSEGGFAMAGVAPGDYWIGQSPVRGEMSFAIAIEVGVGDDRTYVEVRQPGLDSIGGYVTEPSGQFVSGMVVNAVSRAVSGTISTTTDDGGRFQLGPMPIGEYRLTASPGTFFRGREVLASTGDADVGLVVVEPIDVIFRFQLEPQDRLEAVCYGIFQGEECLVEGYDGAGGTATFELAPGDYTLMAATESGFVGVIPVSVGHGSPGSINLVPLRPGGKLRFRGAASDEFQRYLVRMEERLIAVVDVSEEDEWLVVPEGSFHIDCLFDDGRRETKGFMVDSGAVIDVLF